MESIHEIINNDPFKAMSKISKIPPNLSKILKIPLTMNTYRDQHALTLFDGPATSEKSDNGDNNTGCDHHVGCVDNRTVFH